MHEFRPDAHTPNSPLLEQASKELLPLLQEVVKKHTSSEAKNIEFIGGANLNSLNFRTGTDYFKVAEANLEREKKFPNFPKIAAILNKAGVPARDFLTSSGGNFVEPVSYAGRDYLTYRQTYLSGQFFTGAESEFLEMLGIINRMDACANELSSLVTQTFNYPDSYALRLNALANAAKNKLDFFSELFRQNFSLIDEAVQNYELYSQSRKETGVYHCDLHPHNLIVRKGKIAAVVDLESFYQIPRNTFLGFSAYKLARKCLVKKTYSLDGIRSVLTKNLPQENLYQGALLEILRRLFSVLELHYLQGNSTYDTDLQKQLSGLTESKLILA